MLWRNGSKDGIENDFNKIHSEDVDCFNGANFEICDKRLGCTKCGQFLSQ